MEPSTRIDVNRIGFAVIILDSSMVRKIACLA